MIGMRDRAKSAGLSPNEIENINLFFDDEIRGRDANHVLKIYQKLMSEIYDKKVRQ